MSGASIDATRVAGLVEQLVGGGVRVDPHTPLFELDGFSSLIVVDLVERIEGELGREIPAELIAPESFSSPAAVSAALAGAEARGAA